MTPNSLWFAMLLAPIFILVSSCSPKTFSTESSNGGGGTITPLGGPIACGPLLNDLTTSLVLDNGDPNPTLKSHCVPSSVSHTWSVTRSSVPVTINGLSGGNSVPDFVAAGPGTYFIGLDASAVGWTNFHLPSPLQVVVRNTTVGNPDVVCTPKLNGTLTAYTASTSNPTVTANCTPNTGSYVWTVYKNGSPAVVSGLGGSTSTGDFIALGDGTYQIWLSSAVAGYNTFYSTTPLVVTVPTGATTPHAVHETHNITAAAQKLDILLVVDDSSSMLADNQRLASRMSGFVNNLTASGIDWQACVTLTRAQQVPAKISLGDYSYYWGASTNWSGNPNSPAHILKSGTANTFTIFTNTINAIGAGWVGTDDERGIKAAWWHLYNGDPDPSLPGTPSGCYRADAGLAVVILSDEDERSIGGDDTQAYYSSESGKALENDDLPQSYVDYVHQVFGSSKRFTVNSIIVRPGDTACQSAQDSEGSKSHFGTKYNELSLLSSGHVGSICDTDYTTTLNDITTAIAASQASVPLQCTPVGAVTINVSPSYAYTSNVTGGRLYFTPDIPAGSVVTLDYTCP